MINKYDVMKERRALKKLQSPALEEGRVSERVEARFTSHQDRILESNNTRSR